MHRENKTVNIVDTGRGKKHQQASGNRRDFSYMSTDELLRTLDFVQEDDAISIGTSVAHRLGGLAMGNSLSPPLTGIDLDIPFSLFLGGKTAPSEWPLLGRPPRTVVQACLHVDDALVFSRRLCTCCLFRGLASLWPADVSAELEEEGLSITFLHSDILFWVDGVSNRICFELAPKLPITPFAAGDMLFPTIGRLAVFMGHETSTLRHLQSVLWGWSSSTAHLCPHRVPKQLVSWTASYMSEILHLQWPTQMLAFACRTIPKTHRHFVPCFLRLFGRLLATCPLCFETPPTQPAQPIPWFELCLFVANSAWERLSPDSDFSCAIFG